MLPHLLRRVHKKGFAVVVLAEGAGEELLGKSAEVDKGGNRKLPAIGDFIKGEIESYFKEESDEGVDVPVKFIDPSYMVRSVCANSSDSFLCMQLGQNAGERASERERAEATVSEASRERSEPATTTLVETSEPRAKRAASEASRERGEPATPYTS